MRGLAGHARVEDAPGGVVEEIAQHHREDDPEDDEPLGAEGHAVRPAGLLVGDALLAEPVVHEGDAARDARDDEELLGRGVGHPERGVLGQQAPEIEADVVPANDQLDAVQEQDHERAEDDDVSEPGVAVIGHLPLPERVDDRIPDALFDLLGGDAEVGVRCADHQLSPASRRGPRERAEGRDQ